MKRREFIRTIGAVGTAALVQPQSILARAQQERMAYFNLHPFVAAHPEAVFIKTTTVTAKTDATAKKRASLELARELFVASNEAGIPIGSRIAVKPNLTCGGSANPDDMGIITDADFVEGFIEGMKELGLRGEQFYLREGNMLGDAYCPDSESAAWYRPMAERTGAHLYDFDSGRTLAEARLANLEEGAEVIWREVPDGVIFRRIGYVAPINADDAWSLNIAKFKAHGMGLTLSSKNWQGTNVHPYVHYCEDLDKLVRNKPASFVNDVNPEFIELVTQQHAQHLEESVPRWDRPGRTWNSGWGMEGWAQKTLDNLVASRHGLNIIEGIYGRNGNGFSAGPGPNGRPQDFMTNMVIFGRNPIKTDIVGHWLGGHEPGNFGLFHAAFDRGLTDTVDPRAIAVYSWENGQPVQRSLDDFTRHQLSTYYLQRDYAGQGEALYHMVDEPYTYAVPTAIRSQTQVRPQSSVLGQNYPNPFNSTTVIEYQLPQRGAVRLEVFDVHGQVVDILVDGVQNGGAHVAAWDSGHRASGTYFYRFTTQNFTETRKMMLLR